MFKKKMFAFLLALLLTASFFFVGTPSASAAGATWTSVWSTSMVKSTVADAISNSDSIFSEISGVVQVKKNTVRVAITPQGGGDKVRFVLANDFGTSALQIKAITVGKTNPSNTRNVTGSFTTVKYNGAKSFSIPAGQRITTDPVDYDVNAGEQLTVSIYYGNTEPNTIGLYGGDSYTHVLLKKDYTTNANFGGTTSLTRGEKLYSDDSAATGHYDLIPTLCEVDVYGTELDGCCVVFGDSTVTNEIPAYLAAELRANGIDNISVTMAAIKGNNLCSDGVGTQGDLMGISGVSRFQRDVLDQANVKFVIVKMGVNDIIHPYVNGLNADAVSLEEMKDGFRTLSRMSRNNNVYFFVTEIAPWKGYTRNNTLTWSEDIDQLRLTINSWLDTSLHSSAFLHMTRFEALNDSNALLPAYTTDGGHFSDAGQHMMATYFSYLFLC